MKNGKFWQLRAWNLNNHGLQSAGAGTQRGGLSPRLPESLSLPPPPASFPPGPPQKLAWPHLSHGEAEWGWYPGGRGLGTGAEGDPETPALPSLWPGPQGTGMGWGLHCVLPGDLLGVASPGLPVTQVTPPRFPTSPSQAGSFPQTETEMSTTHVTCHPAAWPHTRVGLTRAQLCFWSVLCLAFPETSTGENCGLGMNQDWPLGRWVGVCNQTD